MSQDDSIARPARVISFLTFLSRILGMIRDILFAHFFGASKVWDAFVIAFVIPNMFRHLFGEGAMTSAFVPAFVTKLQKAGRELANALFNNLVTLLATLLCLITFFGVLLTLLIPLFFEITDKLAMILSILRITLPYMILICLTAIFSAALNSMGHFSIPALAPSVMNLVFIAAALNSGFLDADSAIYLVAWAVIIGGVLQLLMQFPPLYRSGMKLQLKRAPLDDELKVILAGVIPVVIGLSVVQLNEFLDNVIAEICVRDHGAVSSLYYANRVVQLPLALVGISVATVAFVRFSSCVASNDTKGLVSSINKALGLCFFLCLPATAGVIVFCPQIIRLLFEHGEFSSASTSRTVAVTICYSIGIFFYSANMVITRAFYSLRDMSTPLKTSLKTVGLNFLLNITLVWFLQEAGIALATSITGFFNFIILNIKLKKKIKELSYRKLLDGSLKIIAATSIVILFAFVIFLKVSNITQESIALIGSILIALISYFILSNIFGIKEAKELLSAGR